MSNFIEELINRPQNSICYNLDIMSDFLESVKNTFSDISDFKILFAIKANPDIRVLQKLSEKGIGADCASMEELQLAKLAGFEYISVTNPGLNGEEIREIIQQGIDFDFDNIAQIKDSMVTKLEIGLRINLNIVNSRFGFALDDVSIEFLKKAKLTIKRLHIHFGNKNECNIVKMREEIVHVIKKYDFLHQIECINLGGGYEYLFAHGHIELLTDSIRQIKNSVEGFLSRNIQIIIEPGSLLAYPLGYLKTNVKYVYGDKVYLGVSNFNLSSWNPVYPLMHNGKNINNKEKRYKFCLYGNTCYEEDCFGEYEFNENIKKGDSLILFPVGAYNYNLIRNLHAMEPPEIVYFENGILYD